MQWRAGRGTGGYPRRHVVGPSQRKCLNRWRQAGWATIRSAAVEITQAPPRLTWKGCWSLSVALHDDEQIGDRAETADNR